MSRVPSMPAPRVPQDVLLFLAAPDRWVAYNVFTRTALGLDGRAVDFIGQLNGADAPADQTDGQTFRVWNVWHFSHADGLLADPTRVRRDPSTWEALGSVTAEALIEFLVQRHLLVADMPAYRARFARMTSVLDRRHFGNFHDQLGQFLWLERREQPAQWWYRQKFVEDLSRIRPNAYGMVQEAFLRQFIPRRFADVTLKVLDLGCGIGHYTRMIAAAGAHVIGADSNPESIALAERHATVNCRFVTSSIEDESSLPMVADHSIDCVFVSDTLLLFFVPRSPSSAPAAEGFFRLLRRVMRPDGAFVLMEPHYLFWLAPWLGEEDRPYTVLTEYAKRQFAVTPRFDHVIQTASRHGLSLVWMEEIPPDEEFESVDRRAATFARQFPFWHLFEFRRFELDPRQRRYGERSIVEGVTRGC